MAQTQLQDRDRRAGHPHSHRNRAGVDLIDRFRENYLSGSEALAIAMEHAGEAPDSAPEASIRLRTRHGSAWYDISWESVDAVHQYMVDAETGEILSAEPK